MRRHLWLPGIEEQFGAVIAEATLEHNASRYTTSRGVWGGMYIFAELLSLKY